MCVFNTQGQSKREDSQKINGIVQRSEDASSSLRFNDDVICNRSNLDALQVLVSLLTIFYVCMPEERLMIESVCNKFESDSKI